MKCKKDCCIIPQIDGCMCECHRPKVRKRNPTRAEKLEKAIENFLKGYDKADKDVVAIYQAAYVHGIKYTGYQYTRELQKLRDLVKK